VETSFYATARWSNHGGPRVIGGDWGLCVMTWTNRVFVVQILVRSSEQRINVWAFPSLSQ